MIRPHRQIITLAVDFDISKSAPPENWEWALVASAPGINKIEVVAAGPVIRLPAPLAPKGADAAAGLLKTLREMNDHDFATGANLEVADRLAEIIFDDTFEEAVAISPDVHRVAEG